MNKIYNKKYDEISYYEKLDNGLKVYINHKVNFKTTSCAIGVKFGSLDIMQEVNGKHYQYSSGIAHFLEHKMFEDEEDIMLKFNNMGVEVNAFTSYDITNYYFTVNNNNIKEPLNLLLDFVQTLNITEQSVESEKDIITQELLMYENKSDARLLFETFKAMYNNHPIKYDIGGSCESIKKITKEELELCFDINYHPSNMILVITTPIDPKIVIDIVKTNQKSKNFDKPYLINRIIKEDIKEVNTKYKEVVMDVSKSKVMIGIKLDEKEEDVLIRTKKEWAIQIALEMAFSSINKKYQKWIDEKIITEYFSYEVDFSNNCSHILFDNEIEDENKFVNMIFNELKNINCDSLEQLKKRYYGIAFRVFDQAEAITMNNVRYILNDLDYYKVVEQIMEIEEDYIKDLFKNFDFSNYTIVKIIKKD